MISTQESTTVRIVPFAASRSLAEILRDGQMASAQVWTVCRDEIKLCLTERSIAHQADATLGYQPEPPKRKWPTRDSLQRLTKGRFDLHSQSVQMVCHAFLANVDTARQLRASSKGVGKKMRYPYRDKTFYPLIWPAQAMCLTESRIILPMGRGRASVVLPRPEWLSEPSSCKIIWNRCGYELHVSVGAQIKPAQECDEEDEGSFNRATVDLGQIHQCAVTTSTGKALIVSGRGIRAEKRRMNKMHGSIAKKQSRCKKGSRRWRRLQRSRNVFALRSERRIRDARHKGTRQVIDFLEHNQVGTVYVGNPDGVRRRNCGKKHNQRMSQWEYGKDIAYLKNKSKRVNIECFSGTERGTSSHCPRCGHRHKPGGRNWVCPACHFTGHRDLVGSFNMHAIAYGSGDGYQKPTFPVSKDVTYLRPGTSARKILLSQGIPDRSNRPDSGHGAMVMVPVSLHESLDSANSACPQCLDEILDVVDAPCVSQGTGHLLAFSSEAHPL